MGNSQFHLQAAELLSVVGARTGAVEWRVRLAGGVEAVAVAYTAFSASLEPGQQVWLNTTAAELGLGTGGVHFILAPVSVGAESGMTDVGAPPERAAGHLMKLRYTPLQHAVLPVEESRAPKPGEALECQGLAGLPVLAVELHSAAMAAAIAARALGARRIVYVMPDGAALPLAFSRLVARLRAEEVLAATITAGQAFGGDREAVTVASALVAARVELGADLIVIGQGPGNAGTGTAFGFSGLAQAEHLHTAAALGGRPVAALRVSFADPRPRHHGLSHHSATVLGRMTLIRASIAVPVLSAPCEEELRAAIRSAGLPQRHDLRQVPADDLLASLAPYSDLLLTMGRSIEEDRAFFLAACAAARLALDSSAGDPWPENAGSDPDSPLPSVDRK